VLFDIPWRREAAGVLGRCAASLTDGGATLILCLTQRLKNIHLAHKVFYPPSIRWKSRKRFETTMALRAIPKMSNKLMIQVFGPFGRDQFVAALDAVDSE
jgi:hypothetical protein